MGKTNLTFYERLREAILDSRGNRCEICHDLEGPFEMAHLKTTPLSGVGRGRGRNRRILDWVRHPDAYALLCKECHSILDGRRPTNGTSDTT